MCQSRNLSLEPEPEFAELVAGTPPSDHAPEQAYAAPEHAAFQTVAAGTGELAPEAVAAEAAPAAAPEPLVKPTIIGSDGTLRLRKSAAGGGGELGSNA